MFGDSIRFFSYIRNYLTSSHPIDSYRVVIYVNIYIFICIYICICKLLQNEQIISLHLNHSGKPKKKRQNKSAKWNLPSYPFSYRTPKIESRVMSLQIWLTPHIFFHKQKEHIFMNLSPSHSSRTHTSTRRLFDAQDIGRPHTHACTHINAVTWIMHSSSWIKFVKKSSDMKFDGFGV